MQYLKLFLKEKENSKQLQLWEIVKISYFPCGACRQVISDFCGEIDVVMLIEKVNPK